MKSWITVSVSLCPLAVRILTNEAMTFAGGVTPSGKLARGLECLRPHLYAKLPEHGLPRWICCRYRRGLSVFLERYPVLLPHLLTALLLLGQTKTPAAKPPEKSSSLSGNAVRGLRLRSVGPALTSGRVVDFAVDPNDPSQFTRPDFGWPNALFSEFVLTAFEGVGQIPMGDTSDLEFMNE